MSSKTKAVKTIEKAVKLSSGIENRIPTAAFLKSAAIKAEIKLQ